MIHQGIALWYRADPLLAPTNVVGTRDGLDIDLTWDHAGGGGATGFRIYRRSRTPGGSFGAYSLWRTVTPETDTDTTDETALGELEYQYRVHAWTGTLESAGAESNVVASVTPIAWSFGYPSDYGPDDTSITWGFDPVVDQDGLEVWYRIGASMSGNPPANGGTEAYEGIISIGTVDLLTEDTVGYIMARARYWSTAAAAYRYGPWSEERSATSRPRIPGAPTSVTFTKATSTTGTLTWTPGSPTTQDYFSIQYAFRTAGTANPWSAWTNALPATDTASPYTFDEVLEGNEYKLRIRATNTGGSSAWVESNVVSFAGPPDPPSGLSAVLDATYPAHYVDLSWTDNSDDETAFRIERAPSASGPWTEAGTVGANVTTFEDQQAGPPIAAPSIASVDSIQDDQLQVTISGLPGNATGWRLYYLASGLDFQVDDTGAAYQAVANTGTTTTLSGLSPDTTYQLRVTATNAAGRGRPSSASSYATGPTAPKSLSAVVNGSFHDLSWSIGTRDGDAILIERNTGSGWSQIASRTAGSTSYSVTALAGASYRVRFSGEATYSNTATP